MAERKLTSEPIRVRSEQQLLRVVQDVVRSSEAASVDVENVGQVTISPLRAARPASASKTTPEEREARRDREFRSSFGSWKGVDGDKLWAEIRASRGQEAKSWLLYPEEE